MSITYPVFLPVSVKSDRFGLNINKAQFSGEFVRNRIAQSHGAGTTDRWEGVYTTPFLGPDQHRDMSAWLEAMSQDDGTFFGYNPNSRSLVGSFDDNNLLGTDAEPVFSSGSIFPHIWLSGISVKFLGIKAGDLISGRVQLKSATGADTLRLEFRFQDIDGTILDTVTGNNVTSVTFAESSFDLFKVPAGADTATLFARNLNETEQASVKEAILSIGNHNFVSYLKVDGASQTGDSINIKDGPVSTNGILRRGDMVQIQNQLYRSKDRVDTDGTGKATIEVGPVIRTAHPDSEPILIKNPVMIAQLVQTDHPQETGIRSTGVISFAWQEVV